MNIYEKYSNVSKKLMGEDLFSLNKIYGTMQ